MSRHTAPAISVIIPARNEADRVSATIQSILETRAASFDLEFVVVDDASTDGCCSDLVERTPALRAPGVSLQLSRLEERVGVARARNEGARRARGEILFITDAHMRFCAGWDTLVFDHIEEQRILAATIADTGSAFKGYGCRLIVPFMGTNWMREAPPGVTPVQIAVSSGTVLKRALFERIGGFDDGMRLYAAAEPEFSVRAWLSGAEIVSVPQLVVAHRFKPKEELDAFLRGLRPSMIHNSLRFGMLYLSEPAMLQMVRYYALEFPQKIQEACRLVEHSDVWRRRAFLKEHLLHDFDWFVERFGLQDQGGRPILREEQEIGP